MSVELVHAFQSAIADSVDTTLVRKTEWNNQHAFSGGTHGGLLYRDTGAPYGAEWLAPASGGRVLVSQGQTNPPAFSTSPSLTALTLSTPLGEPSGGTGQSAYVVGDLIYGSTTTTLARLAAVADGNVLRSAGLTTAPIWGKVRLSGTPNDVTGTLSADKGGTGIPVYTVGDLLYASGATALSALVAVASGQTILSAGEGAPPYWGPLPLDSAVTGILPTVRGGTGRSLLTSGGVLYGVGQSNVGMTAAGADDTVLISSGAVPLFSATPRVSRLTATDRVVVQGGNSEELRIRSASALLSGSGPSLTAAGLLASGCLGFGVVSRVTTGFGVSSGLVSVSIGDAALATRWSSGSGIALGATTDIRDFAAGSPLYYPTGSDVVVTANGGDFDGTGVIRLTAYFLDLLAPAD